MVKMRVVFLGTSCSTPTKDRNLSSVALNFDGQWFLFDCPEGTQRQMMKAKVSYMKIQHVFVSHFHADHFLGLPGLIATMSMQQREQPLYIYGPKGIQEQINKAVSLALMKVSFKIECKEVRYGKVLDCENFFVKAFPLKHDAPCYGFVFKEKDKKGEFQRKKAEALGIPPGPLYSKLQNGKKIKWKGKIFYPKDVMDYSKGRVGKKVSVVMDTLPGKTYFDAIKKSDVLIHEGTFSEKLKERALETAHSTVKEAAEVAKKCKVKKLFIIHISPRHKETKSLEKEAKEVFANTTIAKDLMEINV